MSVNPDNYINMDRQTLSKALDSSPKIIRTVRANKSVVLLNAEYALNNLKYSKIGIDEIHRRIKILDENHQFIDQIKSIISDKAKEKMSMDQTELLHEETIYGGGFIKEKDALIMKNFMKLIGMKN